MLFSVAWVFYEVERGTVVHLGGRKELPLLKGWLLGGDFGKSLL